MERTLGARREIYSHGAEELQGHARDICWKNGLAAKANLGSFDVW
jgi:hypothetical protein